MLRLTWTNTGLEDLEWWQQHDHKMLKRIILLCLETCKNPTQGIGKPEPLKFNYRGYWSRRIDDKHRLVYAFDEKQVTVIQCRYHYENESHVGWVEERNSANKGRGKIPHAGFRSALPN